MSRDEIPANLQKAFQRLGCSRELLQDVAQIYVEDHVPMLRELDRNLCVGDVPSAERLAHSLRGLVATFDRTELVERWALAERHLRSGAVNEALALLPRLQSETSAFALELQDFLRE
jgi:HPt (histidine-containing phosphotransfer) domain-containing protein